MIWQASHRADPFAREIADRHYNRQKIGSPQFVPPAGYVGDTYGEADAKFVAALNPAVCLALISRARGAERLEKERKEATDELVKHMVNRFLWWRLPEDFHPYCGIHFDAYAAINMNPRNTRYEPVGTNLFTATQAEEMVRHMLEGAE